VDSPRRWRLRRFDALEQLPKHPHQAVIILTSEHFGNEAPSLHQEVRGQSQTLQDQFILRESILYPSRTNVRCSIMQDQIRLPIVQMSSELGPTLRSGDIRYEGNDVWKGFDRIEVDTDDEAALWHVLLGYLKPTSWSCTEVDNAFASG